MDILIHRLDTLFDDAQTTRTIQVEDGAFVSDIIEKDEFALHLNGVPVNANGEHLLLTPGDEIIVYRPPHGGNKEGWALGLTIASMIAAPYAGTGLAMLAATGNASNAVVGFSAAFGTNAFLVGSNLLINALFAAHLPKSEDVDIYNASAYNRIANEDSRLPVIYGQALLKPVVKDRYIEIASSTETAVHVLLGLSCHKVQTIGVLDSNSDPQIWINDTQISDFITDDSDIQTVSYDASKLGTYNQGVVDGFARAYTSHPQGVELEYNTPKVVELNPTNMDFIRVDVSFPYGLYDSNNSGDLNTSTCFLQIEYKKHADTAWWIWSPPWGAYHAGIPIRESAQNPLVYAYTLDVSSAPDQYDVRVTKNSVDKDGTAGDGYTQNTLYLQNVYSITEADYSYPGEALLGIHGLPESQLAGQQLNCRVVVERDELNVFDTDWPGWKKKPANNPAWVVYDLLCNGSVNHQSLLEDGSSYGGKVPYANLDYDSFNAWATFCTAEGFEYNGAFTQETNLWSAIMQVCMIGRGIIQQAGQTYFALIDDEVADNDITQVFNRANVLQDAYAVVWPESDAKISRIRAKYLDSNSDYDTREFEISAPDWDDLDYYKDSKDVTLNGVTNHDQAYKLAQFLLAANRYQPRVFSWSVAADGIECQPGDVVMLFDDTQQWGTDGRVVSATQKSTTTEVVLDREVSLTSGVKYELLVRHSNTGVVEVESFTAGSTEDTDTITTTKFTNTIVELDLFLFGMPSENYHLVRVRSISQSSNLTHSVEAIEYNPTIYTTNPTPPITWSTRPKFTTAEALLLTEIHPRALGPTDPSGIELSWSAPNLVGSTTWRVLYRDLDSQAYNWQGIYSAGNTYYIGDTIVDALGSGYLCLLESLGHAPSSSPSYWEQIYFNTTFETALWSSGTTYAKGDAVIWHDGSTDYYYAFKSRAGSNTDHEPYDFDWWQPIIAYQASWLELDVTMQTRTRQSRVRFLMDHRYEFAVQNVLDTGNAQSLQSAARISYRYTGPTSAPPDLAFQDGNCYSQKTMRLMWDTDATPDLWAYEIRDSDANWGTDDDHLIYRGLSTNVLFDYIMTGTRPSTISQTFYGKLRDRSGNYSTTADSVTVTDAAPILVPHLAAATGTGVSIDLTWEAIVNPNSNSNVQGYNIYADGSNPPTTQVGTVGPVTDMFSFSGTSGNTYYCQVIAYDTYGEGTGSVVDSAVMGTVGSGNLADGSITNAKLASSGLSASKFTTGTLSGVTVETGDTGQLVRLDQADASLKFYGSDDYRHILIDGTTGDHSSIRVDDGRLEMYVRGSSQYIDMKAWGDATAGATYIDMRTEFPNAGTNAIFRILTITGISPTPYALLIQTGSSTNQAYITAYGDAWFSGDLDVVGNANITGDLNVDGDTTLDDTTIDGTLSVDKIDPVFYTHSGDNDPGNTSLEADSDFGSPSNGTTQYLDAEDTGVHKYWRCTRVNGTWRKEEFPAST